MTDPVGHVTNFSMIVKTVMASLLWNHYHIRLIRLDFQYSPEHFATYIRGLIERSHGKADMGGHKYYTFLADMDVLRNNDQLYQMCADSCKTIWHSFKIDQVKRIWKGETND
jgi:hypothetical protein